MGAKMSPRNATITIVSVVVGVVAIVTAALFIPR